MKIKADDLRTKLMAEGIRRDELEPDPIKQFESWYQQTLTTDLPEPNGMCLATVDEHGQPWQRMVLLKKYDSNGFVFFTNYESRKAAHIAQNQKVSLLFTWYPLGRQVHISGSASKISTAESLAYFVTREHGSRIGAWASPQSQVIKTRALLDAKVNEIKQKFSKGEIPLPSFWGGYRVQVNTMEFWQAGSNRLHDRFFYQPGQDGKWEISRMAP